MIRLDYIQTKSVTPTLTGPLQEQWKKLQRHTLTHTSRVTRTTTDPPLTQGFPIDEAGPFATLRALILIQLVPLLQRRPVHQGLGASCEERKPQYLSSVRSEPGLAFADAHRRLWS